MRPTQNGRRRDSFKNNRGKEINLSIYQQENRATDTRDELLQFRTHFFDSREVATARRFPFELPSSRALPHLACFLARLPAFLPAYLLPAQNAFFSESVSPRSFARTSAHRKKAQEN